MAAVRISTRDETGKLIRKPKSVCPRRPWQWPPYLLSFANFSPAARSVSSFLAKWKRM